MSEYLADLQCRVSARHHLTVKARLDRTIAALQLVQLSDLQPVKVLRYRNQRKRPTAA